jgi:hypothetical protein
MGARAMTRDDIIRMALKAEMRFDLTMPRFIDELERFAALVAAAEREACAKVCDEVGMLGRDALGKFWTDKCAAAIRARGDK